jgi:hypothetical protein
MIAGIRM